MTKTLRSLLLGALLATAAFGAHAGPTPPLPLPTTLRDAERELSDLDQKLRDAEGRTGRVVADIASRERRALARSRAYARLARAGLLPIAGGFDAFVAHAMKIEGARRAIQGDLDRLKHLRREHTELLQVHDGLSARRAVVAAQRDALGQAQSLIDEAEERRRAFERAFTTSGPPTDHASVYGAGVTVRDAAPRGGFESARGRLPFPLPGRAEVRSVRRGPGGGPALELLAPSATVVRVVHPGRVAFTGPYADYGRLVLVDHGDGYFTVYGNLGAVDVRVGDELSSGARLGTLAESREASLLFEVRHRNETLEPRPWLGL